MEPELIHRAEQAYLGALLAGSNRPLPRTATDNPDSGLSGLMSAADFHDPVHQAIFAAVVGQPADTGGITEWFKHLCGLLERVFSSKAREAAAYMAGLPGLCPDPANLHAYAAMIAEASQQRVGQARAQAPEQAAGEDPTLASAGTWLDNQATAPRSASRHQSVQAHRDVYLNAGPAQAAGTSPSASASPDREVGPALDTSRLSRALRADARRMTRPGQDRDYEPGQGDGNRTAVGPLVGVDGLTAPVNREHLEDRVLASLMKHPADGLAVTGWLPAEAFSTAAHLDLYDLIRQRLAAGRPVDPLIIAWDASQLPNLSPSAEDYGGSAFLTQVALQVSALDPAPGTAEILGKTLWAEHILTNVLGEDWHADPGRVRQFATLAAEDPSLRREPAHDPTGQAALVGPDESALQPKANPTAEQAPEYQKDGPVSEPLPVPTSLVGVTAADARSSVPANTSALTVPTQTAVPAPVQVQQPAEPAAGSPVMRM
jgi:hypothetical protein